MMLDCGGVMRAGECKEHEQGIVNGASWKALLKDE